jgi:hypothetical protein
VGSVEVVPRAARADLGGVGPALCERVEELAHELLLGQRRLPRGLRAHGLERPRGLDGAREQAGEVRQDLARVRLQLAPRAGVHDDHAERLRAVAAAGQRRRDRRAGREVVEVLLGHDPSHPVAVGRRRGAQAQRPALAQVDAAGVGAGDLAQQGGDRRQHALGVRALRQLLDHPIQRVAPEGDVFGGEHERRKARTAWAHRTWPGGRTCGVPPSPGGRAASSRMSCRRTSTMWILQRTAAVWQDVRGWLWSASQIGDGLWHDPARGT